MKILFLIIGPVSFKSATFVRNFIKQLDSQVHSLYVMAENFTFAYLQANKNIKFRSMTENFDEEHFQDYLEVNNFELVVIVNLDILLLDDSNVAFKKSYLSHINTRVLFLVSNSHINFKGSSAVLAGLPQTKTKINFPFSLLKPCPPYIPDMDDHQENTRGVKTFYWKNLETFAFLNKYEARAKLKEQIKASEESKIVTLILDLEHVYVAGNAGYIYHYKVMVECIYRYLANLKIPCCLIVGNLTHLPFEQYSPDVKLFFFSLLQDEDHELVIRATDLMLTESIADTSLIDAANIKLPVVNLKSTLMLEKVQDEEQSELFDIVYDFDELSDFAKSKVEDLIINCPEAIFPYYAFPNVARVNFDETKVFGHYIFTFTELFDEKATTAIFKDLILNEEAIKEEVYRIEQYLALRADALDAQEVLDGL